MIFNNPNLFAVFSSRPHNMSLVYGPIEQSLDNRRDFLGKIGIDYQALVCARQVHGSFVRLVEEKDKGSGALSDGSALTDTDAFITATRNLPVAVFTADCLPVFLYDAQKHVIGLVHAGWRGTRERIAAKTIKFMQDKFNTNPEDLYAGFGPAIRQCCYEVGREFNDFFNFGIKITAGRYYLDLVAINKRQLLDLGIRQENILDQNICTVCQNDRFFSFRKEGAASGRIMSVMMLK